MRYSCISQTQPPEVFLKKKDVFKNMIGKRLCQSLLFNKIASLAYNLIKKETGTGVFL